MKRLHILLFGICLGMCFSRASAATGRQGFAIVIDSASRAEAAAELEAYIHALEQKQNFLVYTVIDSYGVPDSIRNELMRLHQRNDHPIVGAVFIGDIPVPMIRDAQFLTSAFKMSQDMPWPDSSVPSDRFYDDFGLKFTFLKRDSVAPYFYYSLSAQGSQTLSPSIFSGRIRPTDAGGTSRYDKLRAYLRKAVAAKLHPERLTSLLVYTGSGSLSESKVAHIAEMNAMAERFPALANVPGAFRYMDYSDAPAIKVKFMNEVMKPDLGIAFMHHHGDFDTQYLSSYPKPGNIKDAKAYMLHLYRNRLASARRYGYNVDSIRRSFVTADGIPASWLDELTDRKIEENDSLENASANLVLADFAACSYRPNCRIAVFDACYNGAFHQHDCIANEYIFQEGKTVCGIGGTVNVLQDKWPDRYFGLLDKGLMAGRLNQYNPDLEMHVVGDPTFVFAPSSGGSDINAAMASSDGGVRWAGRVGAQASVDEQALAIRLRRNGGNLSDAKLFELLTTSPYGALRLEAFLALVDSDNDTRVKAIETAVTDNYELLQRFAVNHLVKCGDERLIPALVRILCDNNASARVAFNAMQGAQFFPKDKLLAALDARLASVTPYLANPDDYAATLRKSVSAFAGRWDNDIDAFCAGKMKKKKALMQIGFMKIYAPAYKLEQLAGYASTLTDDDLLVPLLSALGWHSRACSAKSVLDMALRISEDTARSARVRDEALKTYKRIKAGGL